ncbi:MAG TPA: hypothetical protein VE054_02585 [Blattabacteriaceae bacterium]|nr:hypothetical protein [Blattabacteriaceae bacterium]
MRIHVVSLEDINNGFFDEGIDFILGKILANAKAYSDGGNGTDDAFAQFFQMLEEAH